MLVVTTSIASFCPPASPLSTVNALSCRLWRAGGPARGMLLLVFLGGVDAHGDCPQWEFLALLARDSAFVVLQSLAVLACSLQLPGGKPHLAHLSRVVPATTQKLRT